MSSDDLDFLHVLGRPGPQLTQDLEAPNGHTDLISGDGEFFPFEQKLTTREQRQGSFADHAGGKGTVVELFLGRQRQKANLRFCRFQDSHRMHIDEFRGGCFAGRRSGTSRDPFYRVELEI